MKKKYLYLCAGLLLSFASSVSLISCDDDDESLSQKTVVASGAIDGKDYVDLGLSVKWATCNVGASGVTKYGDYCVNTDKVEWSSNWRLPSADEQAELINGCYWEWTNSLDGTGVAGEIGTSKINGNKIFLPASGYKMFDDLMGKDSCAEYASSTTFVPSGMYNLYSMVYTLSFSSDTIKQNYQGEVAVELPVRLVSESK